ncbi:branched-chain amino acid ABC transporter permease [Pararobbsia silviterrae]|nr:branched-chain amino acid ABC transporter permease [Pararobbsia silviterrae]
MALAIMIDGVAYGMVLFVIAVGMSITMGLIRVVNLAHCGFAMMGGFACAAFIGAGVRFELAVVLAVLATAAISVPLERVLLRRVYGRSELDQALLTLGLVYVLIAGCNLLHGERVTELPLPAYMTGPWTLLGLVFQRYRLVLIVAGAALAGLIWLILERSDYGLKVRAAVDNTSTAQTLGINTSFLYTSAFAFGSGLAAFGGILGSALMPMEPSYALNYLVIVLAVVTVGGLGKIGGTFAAAVLLGVVDTAAKYLLPDAAATAFYLVMFAVLIVRPQGLFGRSLT